tara:strand:+ start:3372 stop:3593 length:222 start_codon:yes stop_codon:yes gene_type:complete
MSNNDIVKVVLTSLTTGVCAGSAVLLGWMVSSSTRKDFILDWRDVAVMGTIGSVIGSHWGVTGNPWFTFNHRC